jgi:hypothetical protein
VLNSTAPAREKEIKTLKPIDEAGDHLDSSGMSQ